MKLNYKRTAIIGMAFMSILAFWQLYDQVIPYIIENIFGQSTFNTNIIMSIDNVLAIFMLPLFGTLSDKTRTPLGKRTPYVLFGTVAAALLMFSVAFFTDGRNFWGFFISLMLLLVTMATYRTPAVAYMPDVTEKPLRSKANAIINLVGDLGGIFTTVVMMFMLKGEKNAEGLTVYGEDQKFLPVFLVVAAFMVVAVAVMVLSLNENKIVRETNIHDDEPEETGKKSRMAKPVRRSLILILLSVFLWFMAYNAVTTALSRYCITVWNVDLATSSSYLLTATISGVIAFIPLGILSSSVGRKATILIGIGVLTACYIAAGLLSGPSAAVYVVFALVGIGWSAIGVNSFPMVVEMSKGSDVGKYTGFYYTFSMAAQIVTPLLSGWLIDHLGFGYSVLFPYAITFSTLSFITMLFVKHGDSKPQRAASALENFDTED